MSILSAQNLVVDYKIGRDWRNVLNDITLSIDAGEIPVVSAKAAAARHAWPTLMPTSTQCAYRVRSGAADGDDLVPKSTPQMRDIWAACSPRAAEPAFVA